MILAFSTTFWSAFCGSPASDFPMWMITPFPPSEESLSKSVVRSFSAQATSESGLPKFSKYDEWAMMYFIPPCLAICWNSLASSSGMGLTCLDLGDLVKTCMALAPYSSVVMRAAAGKPLSMDMWAPKISINILVIDG